MLASRGLGDSPLFTIPEEDIEEDGMLPEEVIAPIREWLQLLAADAEVGMLPRGSRGRRCSAGSCGQAWP